MKFRCRDTRAEARRILDSDHTDVVVTDVELMKAILVEARRRGLTHVGPGWLPDGSDYWTLDKAEERADLFGLRCMSMLDLEWTFQPPPPPWAFERTVQHIYRKHQYYVLRTTTRHHHDGRVELVEWVTEKWRPEVFYAVHADCWRDVETEWADKTLDDLSWLLKLPSPDWK